jgi:DNA-binding response OmpR family regulator
MNLMGKTSKAAAISTLVTVQGIKTTIGDLEYDAQQQTLRHGELFTSLTLCESKIVAYLFRNPGRHISSDELLRIALGSNARQKTTVVERHICSIRKKIATIKAEMTIQTVRQKGYILKES